MITQQQRFLGILGFIGFLLLIPLVAMEFTNEVDWNLFDFIVMGALMLIIGLSCEMVLRKVKKTEYRLILCAAILAIFFLIWAELAVGIFGTPLAGN